MCVFLFDFRECEGIGALFECLIRTQVLRGPLKLCQECGWVGSRDFYAQIWELTRHHGHMGSMLDADWSRQILLRCDWSVLCRAYHTTPVVANNFQSGTIIWKRYPDYQHNLDS